MKTVIASLAMAAVAQGSLFHTGTIHRDAAPILGATNADIIPGSYIIQFKDHVTTAKADHHHGWVQSIHDETDQQSLELRKRGIADIFAGMKHTFNLGDGFKGYAGHFTDDVIEQIRRHPDVAAIEHDTMVHTMLPAGVKNSLKEDTCDSDVEKQAPWGLARISHRDTLGFGTFNKYLYSHDGGEGVDAYVIDTGTNTRHVDFEGRAKWGKTIPRNDVDEDRNGHGTHCSGTVAGKKYGVAKKAHVYAVKVLGSNGSGTMADVIKGVEFARDSHLAQVKAAKDGKRKGFKGSVANMSLGGGKVTLLDAAVNAAVDSGIHFAVAAGNDNADACSYSPAAATKAVTVGASALDDSRAYFSNYGKCVDIFGPGLSIQSTWIGTDHAINTISGTSMASPHICGLLAYYLSLQPATDSEFAVPTVSPKQLKDNLISIATEGILSDIPSDTPNLLAWNGGGCSDYKKIVEAGGYKVKAKADAKTSPPASMPSTIDELEVALEKDFNMISGKVIGEAKAVTKEAKKLSDKISHLIEDEIKDFLKEFN